MPDLYMDVDIALSDVPVNITPLIDSTDFVTRETGIVYNQAGMDLVWNFVTTAGAYTQTAVTPTTGGDYDWTHKGDAMYAIGVPASGGASINNNTEGFGWFTGYCTGVLSWRGPIIGFRAAGINNLMIDSAYSATRGLAGTNLDATISSRNSVTPPTVSEIQAEMEENGASILDTLQDRLTAARAGYLDNLSAGAVALAATALSNVTWTDARAQVLSDWINDGRLDLILDIIAADVAGLNGDAMRGTDSAALAATALSNATWTDARAAVLSDWIDAGRLDAILDVVNANVSTILSRVIGTILAGNHTAQGGDAHAIVSNGTYGNSALQVLIEALNNISTTDLATALSNIYLDHLFATDYDPAAKPGIATALLNELIESDGGVSRYTANALEQAPGGAGTNPNLLLDAEIAVVNTQTEFTLASGSDVDDAYNDQAIVLYDDSNSDYPSVHVVNNYVGATKTVTIDSAPVFTLAADDSVKIFVTAPGTTAPTAAQNRIEMDANSTRLASIDSNSFVGLQGGLNLNFRINEKSGRLIYDKLHAGFKGILDDGITFVEGVKGRALNFSGSESVECRSWWNEEKHSDNPLVSGQPGYMGVYFPNLIDVGNEIWMYYSMLRDDLDIITGLSKSSDGGKTFTYFGVALDTSESGWDAKRAHDVCVIYDSDDLLYKMWYAGSDDDFTGEIGYATSLNGEIWTKQGIVFEKGEPGDFDEGGVTYMTVLKEAGTYYMWYSGYDLTMTYQGMGLATSPDGITWTRVQTTPVLAGQGYHKGVVKKYNGIYYMLFNSSQTSPYLYVAYSLDKTNWTININPIIEKSLVPEDWDGLYLADAGWYSLNDKEAVIYYTAYKNAGLNDSIGLITVQDVALKAQQGSIVNQYPISIACWVKTTDSGASKGILSLGPTTGPKNGFALYVDSGRLKAFYAVDGSNYVNMLPEDDDGGIINDGYWHHIIFTVDSGGGEIFVDLVSQNSVAWTGTPGISTTIEYLKIGEYVDNIIGQIDDVRIYDHTLSADERRGIVMGVPYLEDNTLEVIIDQEAMPEAINAEVVDALNVDTYAEPEQGNPPATASLVAKIGYLYKTWRNKKDNDGTTTKIYADNGTTVDQKSTVSEVDGTVTVGEMESGE